MGTVTKNFTYDSNAESWSYVKPSGGDKTSGQWALTYSAVETVANGRNVSTNDAYWEWVGTWEDLGVPSGETVSDVTLDYDWRCTDYNLSNGYQYGPATIYDNSATPVLIGTFSSQSSLQTGTTGSLATVSGSTVTIGASYEASTTTIRLRLRISMSNQNDNAALTRVIYDNVALTITDSTLARRIFIM